MTAIDLKMQSSGATIMGTPNAMRTNKQKYHDINQDNTDQWGLHYLIQSLKWDRTTAKDIRTVLNTFQLISGFVCHIFESPDLPITYLPTGWIPHILRDRLRVLSGRIPIKDA